MKKTTKSIYAIIAAAIVGLGILFAVRAAGNEKPEMILFYSPTCPHCHKANDFLDKVEGQYPSVKISRYNTQTGDGRRKMQYWTSKLNENRDGYIPFAVFGGAKAITGFGTDETTGAEYRANLDSLANEAAPE
jgi:thiol-disulfide isomerase/thioredoxin